MKRNVINSNICFISLQEFSLINERKWFDFELSILIKFVRNKVICLVPFSILHYPLSSVDTFSLVSMFIGVCQDAEGNCKIFIPAIPFSPPIFVFYSYTFTYTIRTEWTCGMTIVFSSFTFRLCFYFPVELIAKGYVYW